MKRAITLFCLAAFTPAHTMAGALTSPIIPVVNIAPPPTPGEFYIGGTFALNSGVDDTPTGPSVPVSGDMFGVFAGYNVLRNAPMIYGLEAAYLSGSAIPSIPPDAGLSYIIDAKARLGFRFGGSAMVYGVAGGSFSTYDDGGGASIPVAGFNYGAGVEYKVNPRIFVGVEFLARSLSGNDGIVNPELTANSTQFRVGISF